MYTGYNTAVTALQYAQPREVIDFTQENILLQENITEGCVMRYRQNNRVT